jgi:hypothetical protein
MNKLTVGTPVIVSVKKHPLEGARGVIMKIDKPVKSLPNCLVKINVHQDSIDSDFWFYDEDGTFRYPFHEYELTIDIHQIRTQNLQKLLNYV